MLINSQEKRWDLAAHVVQVENEQDAIIAMQDAKTRFGLNPELVTIDFSPSMLSAAGVVFGDDVIGIDGFHVMQELNNGIRRDLLDFRDRRFKSEIRELMKMRSYIHDIQGMVKGGVAVPLAMVVAGTLPAVDPRHPSSSACSAITGSLIDILKIDDPGYFFRALVSFLDKKEDSSKEFIRSFVDGIRPTIPEKRHTEKGMDRAKQAILKKVKGIYLDARTTLEEDNTEFYKDHWIVFFQPERMTEERQQCLERFLSRYPELRIYREMTLQVGEIYRLPIDQIDGHQIADLQERPSFSKKLNTAIQTLKKHAPQIYRFVDVFKRNPDLPKRCRSSMEWYNVRFKTPFKAGNNLVKKERLMTRLRMQLHGHVEWRVPAATVV